MNSSLFCIKVNFVFGFSGARIKGNPVQSDNAKEYGDVLTHLLDLLSADIGLTLLRSTILHTIEQAQKNFDNNITDAGLIKEKALLTLKVMDFTDNIVRTLIKYSSEGYTRTQTEIAPETANKASSAGILSHLVKKFDHAESGAVNLLLDDKKKLSAILSAA